MVYIPVNIAGGEGLVMTGSFWVSFHWMNGIIRGFAVGHVLFIGVSVIYFSFSSSLIRQSAKMLYLLW